jgi:hypothetical protein
MFLQTFIRRTSLALSSRPLARREAEIREDIQAADLERGLGVMASLSRGSVLMQNEEVFLGERKENQRS